MKNALTLLLLKEFKGHRPDKSQNSARNSNCNLSKINGLYICVHVCLYVHPKGPIRPILWMCKCQRMATQEKKSHWQPERHQEKNLCLLHNCICVYLIRSLEYAVNFIHEHHHGQPSHNRHASHNQTRLVYCLTVLKVFSPSMSCDPLLSKQLQQKVGGRMKKHFKFVPFGIINSRR